MYSSNSPNAKRNLKPTGQQPQAYSAGTSASPTQLTLSSTQPTGPYSALGHPSDPFASYQPPPTGPGPLNPPPPPPPNQQQPNPRKRRADDPLQPGDVAAASSTAPFGEHDPLGPPGADLGQPQTAPPPPKKGRTNTPWTPAEEQRLKTMRDQGTSWSEIAKHFPSRTEGSVKKHWYKDMHYAEFAEDESQALLAAIKEYEASKWKVIGAKVGKPAKACEQYAKEHFGGKM
ncbi:hypothetical protein EV356DRAFT_25911 [Viridothelium virens]|uniref:Uncharacterized protein n=1 Tax=Viridothelium virens TaxID=1048519 RepID=A0A6A6HGF3_VIRVR|nr:hypothetical protein EV356DRAFT_25911 [Viridothelium virens]